MIFIAIPALSIQPWPEHCWLTGWAAPMVRTSDLMFAYQEALGSRKQIYLLSCCIPVCGTSRYPINIVNIKLRRKGEGRKEMYLLWCLPIESPILPTSLVD